MRMKYSPFACPRSACTTLALWDAIHRHCIWACHTRRIAERCLPLLRTVMLLQHMAGSRPPCPKQGRRGSLPGAWWKLNATPSRADRDDQAGERDDGRIGGEHLRRTRLYALDCPCLCLYLTSTRCGRGISLCSHTRALEGILGFRPSAAPIPIRWAPQKSISNTAHCGLSVRLPGDPSPVPVFFSFFLLFFRTPSRSGFRLKPAAICPAHDRVLPPHGTAVMQVSTVGRRALLQHSQQPPMYDPANGFMSSAVGSRMAVRQPLPVPLLVSGHHLPVRLAVCCFRSEGVLPPPASRDDQQSLYFTPVFIPSLLCLSVCQQCMVSRSPSVLHVLVGNILDAFLLATYSGL